MKPLNRSVFQMKDITEQSASAYVCFPPAGDRVSVAIDNWNVKGGVFMGWLAGEIVVSLPADASWVVYHRSLLNRLTKEEVAREGAAQLMAEKDLTYELYPETKAADDEEQEMLRAQMNHNRKVMGLQPATGTVKSSSAGGGPQPGQYL